jgi:hypothetical protein
MTDLHFIDALKIWQHPPPSGLESFEQEGGLRAQVDAAARAMGLEDKRAEAL